MKTCLRCSSSTGATRFTPFASSCRWRWKNSFSSRGWRCTPPTYGNARPAASPR
ncbi:hypothetical protein M8494_30980 [Serratia ureilytica]